jgi:glycosyltransferase involved in cell wall biosynthesis
MALRGLVHRSDRVFVHVDPVHVEWADPADRSRMTILPTGTAIPPVAAGSADAPRTGFTIVVFGLSDMHEAADAEALVQVVERAADRIPGIRLHLVGRGADVGGPDVRRRLAEHSVDVEFEGVVPEPRVSEVLSGGDVFLFLRSGVSSRRSTVVAALAHGLPIVGYQGAETGWPVTEAGLALADHGDDAGVAQLLVELAEDQEKRSELAARSRQAFDKYFSWSRIADVLQGSLQSTNGREGSR